jgi:hypothetical protein
MALFGLLPVGYKSAQDSRRETRAAFIAEQINSDLRASIFTKAAIVLWDGDDKFLASSPIDLSAAQTFVLGGNSENRLVKECSTSDYVSGIAGTDLEFLAEVKVEKTAFDDLSQITIEVSTPAGAPLGSRQRYGFSSFIRSRQ